MSVDPQTSPPRDGTAKQVAKPSTKRTSSKQVAAKKASSKRATTPRTSATRRTSTNKPSSPADETSAVKPQAAGEDAEQAGHNAAPPRKSGDYIPTESQVRTLGVFLTAEEDVSIRELCKRSGIDSSTFYRWMQRPDFRRWWNDATESVLRGARAGVLAALTKRAEQGDLSAIKVWLQRFDRIEAGDRQSLQDLYRDLIRRFASEEYLAKLHNEAPPKRNNDSNYNNNAARQNNETDGRS